MTVPEELVNVMVMDMLDTMEEWHLRNDVYPDMMVCSAAVMVAAKILNSRLMGMPETGTLQ